MQNWISIEEKQPEDGQIVYTYFEFSGVEIAVYKNLRNDPENLGSDLFYNKKGFLTDDVTYWMPIELPAAPETSCP